MLMNSKHVEIQKIIWILMCFVQNNVCFKIQATKGWAFVGLAIKSTLKDEIETLGICIKLDKGRSLLSILYN